jgi:glycosyltransferase involved in cell wall biosynthesis
MDPHKILFISYLFSPENTIGAIRPTKIAKYLALRNNIVDVVSVKNKVHRDEYFVNDAKYVNHLIELDDGPIVSHIKKYYGNVSTKNKSVIVLPRSVKPKWMALKHFYRQGLLFLSSIDFLIKYREYLKNNSIQLSKYDILITSYGPLGSLLCGLYTKLICKNIFWISDYRDPLVHEDTSSAFRPILTILQKLSTLQADKLIFVTNGYMDRVLKGSYKYKASVMVSGYDLEDLCNVGVDKSGSEKYTISYLGSLYEGKRTLEPIFNALKKLSEKDIININDVIFNYAGNDIAYLIEQASKYNLEKIIHNYGYLSREKSISVQHNSRVLVISTWNSPKESGVLPGKFVEYLLFKKPIIGIVSGTTNSELAKVIQENKIGCVYEYHHEENNTPILEEYIEGDYKLFLKQKPSIFTPSDDFYQKYNYAKIIDQLLVF